MALVPTGGALRAFVHRKDLETHRKLLAGSKGEAERSRSKRLLTATSRMIRAVSGRSAGAGRPTHRGRDQRSRKVIPNESALLRIAWAMRHLGQVIVPAGKLVSVVAIGIGAFFRSL